MDDVTKLIPMLWDMSQNRSKKRFAVNVHSKEDEIIVSILSGKRWKRFKNKSTTALMHEIKESHVLA